MNTSANTRKKRAVTFCSPILMTIRYNPFFLFTPVLLNKEEKHFEKKKQVPLTCF